MDRKFLISILSLLAFAIPFMAKADRFYIEPAAFEPGTTETIRFILENSQDYCGFQAEVRLPEGLEVLKSDDGELDITLSARADNRDFRVNSNMLPDGSLIMGAFSTSHSSFAGTDGGLVDLKVSVADSFEGGVIEVSEIIFIDNQDKDVEFDSTSAAIGVLPTGIALKETEISLMEGETAILTATVAPESATERTVTWTSSDTAIATVSDEGTVTAVAAGTVTVTATTVNGKTAECAVTVTPKPIEVTGITLSASELNMMKGETATLTVTIIPEDATDKTVTWASSDVKVVTVSDEGVVTATGRGTATVTATSSNGMTAECTVTVEATDIEVTRISLSSAWLNMTEGDTATLTAIITPEDATDKTVVWASTDVNVATVSAEGLVTAVEAGTATVTATSSNGKVAACIVTVEAVVIDVTRITLNVSELTMTEGETATLTASVTPENATDKTVSWASSDVNVATVTEEGTVTAVGTGTATVMAISANGKIASCLVTVVERIIEVGGIALSESELSLTEGETATLTATITPEDATDKSLTWTSSDENVATVTEEGTVTAVGAGTATITVASANGLTADCLVKVAAKTIEAAGIALSESELSLTEGETATLTATVTPEDATDKSVTWTSSDENVATVSGEGTVTAVGAGTAIITVASANGLTADCTVTVEALRILAESLTIDPTVWNSEETGEFTIVATVLPENATDKRVAFESSDASVATVDEEGHVTVLTDGMCVITVTTLDGSNLKAECVITKTSGIGAIFADPNAEVEVFDAQGMLLKRACTIEQLKQLKPAVYILRSGDTVRKVVLR